MVTETALDKPITSVLEAIRPFQADDGHKGSFLILRIAGLEQGMALRIVRRKYRSYMNWRSTDPYFKRVDDVVPTLAHAFGGEARVIRTALLDISIIETGISVFKKILRQEPITEGMWSYAVRMAGLRVPMMKEPGELSNPWERLANSIKNTMAQRELTVMQEPDGTKSVTAKEIVIEPSPEQRQMASEIVQKIIQQAGESQ
jgi:hypothetical protein